MSDGAAADLYSILVSGGAECSALLRCTNRRVLEHAGFEHAFWGALDEGPVEGNIVLVGRAPGPNLHEGWAMRVLPAAPDMFRGRTDDSEGLARHGGHVYVLGSHFGPKKGPLSARRAFIARFNEEEAARATATAPVSLEVRRIPFKLHRSLNDALTLSGLSLLPVGAASRAAFVQATRSKGRSKDKHWAPDIHAQDSPINIEGIDFSEDGTALLGLRYPCTIHGHPLLLRVSGFNELFHSQHRELKVERIHVLSEVGSRAHPAGIRAIERAGTDLHVLTGPVADTVRSDALADDYPETRRTPCQHWRFPLRATDASEWTSGVMERHFSPGASVEGLALLAPGRYVYAFDSGRSIDLKLTAEA